MAQATKHHGAELELDPLRHAVPMKFYNFYKFYNTIIIRLVTLTRNSSSSTSSNLVAEVPVGQADVVLAFVLCKRDRYDVVGAASAAGSKTNLLTIDVKT